jgi:hypothetical protein
MMTKSNSNQLQKAAIISGIGLLIMTVLAITANFIIFKNIIIPGNAESTVNNILVSEFQFRIGICSFLIVILCDILVAWAFYILFKPVNSNLSLLTAWLRIIYAVIFAAALVNYINILNILNNPYFIKIFGKDQLNAKVMLFINTFITEWNFGLIFFGIHLSLLGYLIFKSGFIHKIIGILVIISGLGYLIENISRLIFPNVSPALGLITGWGELVFMLWLLIKGYKIKEPVY